MSEFPKELKDLFIFVKDGIISITKILFWLSIIAIFIAVVLFGLIWLFSLGGHISGTGAALLIILYLVSRSNDKTQQLSNDISNLKEELAQVKTEPSSAIKQKNRNSNPSEVDWDSLLG